MAAGNWKDWAQGEIVTEAGFQDIQDSIAFIYASESAANTALTNKVEGTQFYDTGADELKIWDGSAWQSVGAAGLVLLSSNAVSSSSGITVDSIFSSTYTNYKIVASITGSHTTTQFFRIVLRTSGADNTNSTYTSGVRTFRISADNEFEQRDDATTYFNLTGWDGTQTNNRESIDITLYSPAETARTQYSGTFATDEVTAQQMGYLGGTFENTTTFDGIKIFPSAGTFTGQINIYGLAE